MMRTVWTFVLTWLLAAPAFAAGWTQPAGETYAKLWLRGLLGSAAFDSDGDSVGTTAYRDIQLNFYAEHGLSEDWTLIGFGAPVGYAHTATDSRRNDTDTFYMGPMGVGGRYRLLRGEWNAASELRYAYAPAVGDRVLPLDAESTSAELERTRLPYRPALENHAAQLQLQLGRGLGTWGWISAYAGFQLNSAASMDHAVTGFAQLGATPWAWLTVDLHVTTYQPIGEVTSINVSGVGQTRYVGIGIGITGWLSDDVGLHAGADGAFLAYSNAATPSLMLGVELR